MSPPIRNPSRRHPHAVNLLLLTYASGVLDGLSYFRSHVFTANMTGNTVLLGIHLVQHDTADAWRSLSALLSWAFGCLITAALLLKKEDRGGNAMAAGFLVELALLLIFGVVYPLRVNSGKYLVEMTAICGGAMALAVQSVVVRNLQVSGVATTYITGTITTAMVGVVRIFRRDTPPARKQEQEQEHVFLLLGMPLIYLLGAVCAALASARIPVITGFIPAAIVAIVLLRSARLRSV